MAPNNRRDPRAADDRFDHYRHTLRTRTSQPLRMLNWHAPALVHISNLNDNITEQFLARALSHVRRVKNIAIPFHNERRIGHALVTLTTQADIARLVAKFDGASICGQRIRVRNDPGARKFSAALHAICAPHGPFCSLPHVAPRATIPEDCDDVIRSPAPLPPACITSRKRARLRPMPSSTSNLSTFAPSSNRSPSTATYGWTAREARTPSHALSQDIDPPALLRLDGVPAGYDTQYLLARMLEYAPIRAYRLTSTSFVLMFRTEEERNAARRFSPWLREHPEISPCVLDSSSDELEPFRGWELTQVAVGARGRSWMCRDKTFGVRERDQERESSGKNSDVSLSNALQLKPMQRQGPPSETVLAWASVKSFKPLPPPQKEAVPSEARVGARKDTSRRGAIVALEDEQIEKPVDKAMMRERTVTIAREEIIARVTQKSLGIVSDQIVKLRTHKYKSLVNKAVAAFVEKQEREAAQMLRADISRNSTRNGRSRTVQRPVISMFSQMAEYYTMRHQRTSKTERKGTRDNGTRLKKGRRSRFSNRELRDNRRTLDTEEMVALDEGHLCGEECDGANHEAPSIKKRTPIESGIIQSTSIDGQLHRNQKSSVKRNVDFLISSESVDKRDLHLDDGGTGARRTVELSIPSDDEGKLESLLSNPKKSAGYTGKIGQSLPNTITSDEVSSAANEGNKSPSVDTLKTKEPVHSPVSDEDGAFVLPGLHNPRVVMHPPKCARTEGYVRSDIQRFKQELLPPDKQALNNGIFMQTSRENRQQSRRIRKGISELNPKHDVISLNFLRQRKKQLRFAKSRIHGMGLYALEDIEAGEFVVEYIGEIIRSKVADEREKLYTRQGMGDSYLFRLEAALVVDATRKGSLARFINHSCDPNVIARIITVGGEPKIVFYSKREIKSGDELTYDYKFDFESEDKKIPCLCGTGVCRKTLN